MSADDGDLIDRGKRAALTAEAESAAAQAKLARIAALCDRVQPGWQQVVSVEAVRGILRGAKAPS